jgi:hypothetical protein
MINRGVMFLYLHTVYYSTHLLTEKRENITNRPTFTCFMCCLYVWLDICENILFVRCTCAQTKEFVRKV